MRKFSILAVLAMAACTSTDTAQVSKGTPTLATKSEATAPLFPAAPQPVTAGARRNAGALAQDFMELSFAMESGRPLPWFSRFEGPITVALTGAVPPSAPAEMQRLIGRLRSEAGLPVSFASGGKPASITVEFGARAQLRRVAPSAACFVVPNVATLSEYTAARGTAAVDWAQVKTRTRAAIFVPAEASAQEIRDCLHEEVAQAIGPLNDLYRLHDSVFNDDNFNTVLTAFDMQILRMYYAPELRNGMVRTEVQAALPRVAARMAPAGPAPSVGGTPRVWIQSVEAALGGRGGQGARIGAAERALGIARAQGWRDARLAFSHFALGRLFIATDPARAVQELTVASRIYAALPSGQVHVAHIDMQLAAIAVGSGQPEQAIRLTDRAIPVIRRAENASLLATVMLIKAEALDLLGRTAEAASLRLDSQPQARYGFGSDASSRARQREISALGARGRRG